MGKLILNDGRKILEEIKTLTYDYKTIFKQLASVGEEHSLLCVIVNEKHKLFSDENAKFSKNEYDYYGNGYTLIKENSMPINSALVCCYYSSEDGCIRTHGKHKLITNLIY